RARDIALDVTPNPAPQIRRPARCCRGAVKIADPASSPATSDRGSSGAGGAAAAGALRSGINGPDREELGAGLCNNKFGLAKCRFGSQKVLIRDIVLL